MITPRKNETAAVEAILNSDQYDDATAMAKAIVKAVAGELDKRDKYLVGLGYHGASPHVLVGPFYGEAEATKFMAAMAERGWTQAAATLWNPDRYRNPESEDQCGQCRHERGVHMDQAGLMPSDTSKDSTCAQFVKGKRCDCSGFHRRLEAVA